MRHAIVALAAVAIVGACYGSSNEFSAGHTGGPVGSGNPVVPDGGPDAGDGGAGDGGADAGDAGLACTQPTITNWVAIDSCPGGSGASVAAFVSIDGACGADITFSDTNAPCTGVAVGASNAFDGGCGGFAHCTSPSLPGNITCTGLATPCVIRICPQSTGCN
jgi:hypothetical protein